MDVFTTLIKVHSYTYTFMHTCERSYPGANYSVTHQDKTCVMYESEQGTHLRVSLLAG